MTKMYLQRPVGRAELSDLAILARNEESAFFARNPHLSAPYENRLLAAALCQGAALQFLGHGYGVADFDIHFFYAQNPDKPRLSRSVKRLIANVGGFERAPVDFVRTVVPYELCRSHTGDPIAILTAFLRQCPSANAKHLATKAVVGLFPDVLFGRVIWANTAGQAPTQCV